MNHKQTLLMRHKSVKFRFFLQSLITNCALILVPLLIMGAFQIVQSSADNTKSIEKSVSQTLIQLDDFTNRLYSHLDNAVLFLSTNPNVTIQLNQAFQEKALTLDSLKNIENISLYFQNLLFTDPYLNRIYVYYDNENGRIYSPPKGSAHSIASDYERSLVNSYHTATNEDFWIEYNTIPDNYSDSDTTLNIYQKLYQRTASTPSGFACFSYNLRQIGEYFESLLQYDEQTIYLTNADGDIFYTNTTSADSSKELALLLAEISHLEPQLLHDVSLDQGMVKASYLTSGRENGFLYITYTPAAIIYKSTNRLSTAYIVMLICAVLVSFLLALFKTNQEYSYLNKIIDIFSAPKDIKNLFKPASKSSSNPFEYIMLNIIKLFLEQDYLKVQDKQKEYKMRMLKMQALQYQINPHFLHNTLNVIYWESIKLTASENFCSKMVSKLSQLMRYALAQPEETVSIEEELLYAQTYLDIMQLRYSDKFTAVYRIDPQCKQDPIKKMILQPLIENAIYHGVKMSAGQCTLVLGVKQLTNSVLVYVLDTGVGITPDELTKLKEKLALTDEFADNHVGLSNVNLRLTLAYGNESRLRFKSIFGQYTCVYFFLANAEIN